MRINTLPFILLLFLAACTGTSGDKRQDLSDQTYETYCNERYAYCVDYPGFLIPQGEAGNQDGQTFESEDGKNRMLVYFEFKMDIATGEFLNLKEAFEQDQKEAGITEKQLFDNYYILSGSKNGNPIELVSVVAYDGYINLRFEYEKGSEELLKVHTDHILSSLNITGGPGDGFGGETENEFLIVLDSFLSDCWWEKDFNKMLINKDKNLAQYIHPDVDVRRFYAPGAAPLLATRAERFGFEKYDFSKITYHGGEYSFVPAPYEVSPCEFESVNEVYYELVDVLPDFVINTETLVTDTVESPFPGAPIMCVYLVPENSSVRAFYFIKTPDYGWKLAFINDTFCSA